ncbi:MAG: ISKra4 family transposase [Streptosporangiaceae bacterium]|nr:ISKra4 family transposase [Streptosporangiaceae bacterium]
MKITVQLVIDAQDGTPPTVEHVTAIARDDLAMSTAGLALAEAHEVLSGVQHHLVAAQVQAAVDAERNCAQCGRARARKDTRTIVLRTLFGTLRLDSPRLKACPCSPSTNTAAAATFSPVAAALPERTSPELLLWEAKYAALTSYGAAATLLAEAFPLGRPLHATTIRQQVERTATRLEDELGEERFSFIDTCPRDLETMPRPDLPLVVATRSPPRPLVPPPSRRLPRRRRNRRVAPRPIDPCEPVPPCQQHLLGGIVEHHGHRATAHPQDVLTETHPVGQLHRRHAELDMRRVVYQPLTVDKPLTALRSARHTLTLSTTDCRA